MLEQLRYFFCINEDVCEWMDSKIKRLDAKIKKENRDEVSQE